MEILSGTQSIDFESRAENIVLVERFVDKICEGNSVSEDYYGNILIALTEAVNNAIHHGNKQDPSKTVIVKVESHDSGLKFTVVDQGLGFDYDNLPDPTDPVNIEKPSGRGVFLMQNLADRISFEDEGRMVELHFDIA